MIYPAATLFLLFLVPDKTGDSCGLKNTSVVDGRANATIAPDRRWPWHVLIVLFKKCVCGGTLVAPGYVVTNGRCVSYVQLPYIKVMMNEMMIVISLLSQVYDFE